MSKRQIESCAQRLREHGYYTEAQQFEQDMKEATRLGMLSTQLRRNAWELYRETLGVSKRD